MDDLNARAAAARAAVAALAAWRQQVDANEKQLEGPGPVRDYIAFFADFFARAADEIEKVAAEIESGITPAHVDSLRQVASNAAAEQRRSVMFRDKWVNKPLAYEAQRAMLTGISNTVREQTDALRSLTEAAASLEAAATQPGESATDDKDQKGLDRRQLFTRLFRPPDET